MAHRPASASMRLPVPAEQAWDLVTDVRNHARWIPLTRIDADHPLRVGDAFAAVTGPRATRGGRGLVDRMRVTAASPPTTAPPRAGRAAYRKLGPVLLGTAEVRVAPLGPHACTVTWLESIHLRGLPAGLVAPVARPLAAAMVRSALRAVAAELASRPATDQAPVPTSTPATDQAPQPRATQTRDATISRATPT